MQQLLWVLYRQWFSIKKTFWGLVINYVVLRPAIFSVGNGYFVPLALFKDQARVRGTEMMVGVLLLQIFVTTYSMLVELIHEFEETRVFQYHVIATSYFSAFTARFVFFLLFTYGATLPFLPMAKVYLGDHLVTENLSWGALGAVLFLVVFLVVSYSYCLSVVTRSMRDVEHLWSLGVEPVLWLSGMWVPAYAIARSGMPGMASFMACNPFAYATDALRQLFFADIAYASLALCCTVITGASIFFMLLAYWLVKRRLAVL